MSGTGAVGRNDSGGSGVSGTMSGTGAVGSNGIGGRR